MITREELSDVLKKAGFKGKAIQRILSKNIRTILDRANAENERKRLFKKSNSNDSNG